MMHEEWDGLHLRRDSRGKSRRERSVRHAHGNERERSRDEKRLLVNVVVETTNEGTSADGTADDRVKLVVGSDGRESGVVLRADKRCANNGLTGVGILSRIVHEAERTQPTLSTAVPTASSGSDLPSGSTYGAYPQLLSTPYAVESGPPSLQDPRIGCAPSRSLQHVPRERASRLQRHESENGNGQFTQFRTKIIERKREIMLRDHDKPFVSLGSVVASRDP
nr:hypothetical protein CFP56_65160 [Quercus suber]